MKNEGYILKILQDNLKDVESKVKAYDTFEKNQKRFNYKKRFIYYLEAFLPYIVASFISGGILKNLDHSIFKLDEVKYYENIQENLFSNGTSYVNSSNKLVFDDYFYTSTAWKEDDNGNYCREEVYYNLEALDNYDYQDLLCMSQEEIKELFPVIDERKYIKNKLTADDLKYSEDLVIVSKSYRKYYEDFDMVQTISDNLFDIFIWLAFTIAGGLSISKIIVRHRFSDNMKAYFEEIANINIKEYRELLKIRQENLNLLLEKDEKKLKKGRNKDGLFHFAR